VAEGNAGARQLYEAMGFAATGAPTPHPSNPSLVEQRMVLPIA
jgi:hypothetical protein